MTAEWLDRLAGFCRNDLEHAPFGLSWLKGVTPARFAVLFLISSWPVITVALNLVGRREPLEILQILARGWMGTLVSHLPLFLMVIWTDRATAGSPMPGRIAALAAAILAGSVAHPVIQTLLAVVAGARDWRAFAFPLSYGFFLMAVPFGGIFAAVLVFAERERKATRRLQQARLARLVAERGAAEARVQALNAQIEPHFLFNSLASVKRLYEQERGSGRELLRSFGAYMRNAVERSRRLESSVGAEVDLARSFFGILQARMGERLRVRIDVPEALLPMSLPGLMLGTLVENAVKHGIGPRASGGTIEITARAAEGRLVLCVSDDGVGFHGQSGTGVGLANTRARLRSLYGDAGTLELRRRPEGGVIASVALPLKVGSADEARPDAGEASREPARSGYLARFRAVISRKHWVWAIAAGLAIALYGYAGDMVAKNAQYTAWQWVEASIFGLFAACLYMLAIVAAEAWPRDGRVLARHHVVSGLAATVVFLFVHAFPIAGPADCVACVKATGVTVKQKTPGELRRYSLGAGLGGVIDGVLGTVFYVWLRNARRAAAALAEAEIARADADRRLAESRLEAVQAEVDPTFVFATLASVEGAYERDRAEADAMLDELIAFLRAAIPRVRGAEGEAVAGAPAAAMT